MSDLEKDKITSVPSLTLPEHEMTSSWYKQCVRHFSKYYSNPVARYEGMDAKDSNPVKEILQFYAYYLGQQENVNYNHLTQDGTGATTHAVWIKGQKIAQLIDYMEGVLGKTIANISISAEALSKDAYNKRTEKFNKLMLEFELKKLLEEAANEGIEFSESEGQEFETSEDIYRFMERDWKEDGVIFSQDIAKHIMFYNHYLEKYSKAGMGLFLTGISAIHNYLVNGQVIQELVPAYNLIWDNSIDDDYNRRGRFVGVVRRLTIPELLAQYGGDLSDAEIKELKDQDKDFNRDFLDLNKGTNIQWWTPGMTGNVGVSVVTMYWVSSKDLKYEKKIDPYGNKHYSKVKKNKKPGEYWTTTVRKATLIGNRYLVEYGECNNIVRDDYNPGDSLLPVRMFVPKMFLGRNKSIVARLKDHQDHIDALTFKIKELIGRDLGKVYIINGFKLGEGVTAKRLITDFKSMGFTVTEGVSGEDDDSSDNKRTVEQIDMTLDPNIKSYMELIREEERVMEEIINVSKISLGQQRNVIGKGVQEMSISQSSTGTSYWYDGMVRHIEDALQYAVNMWKVSRTSDNDEETERIIGDRGAKWIEITKNMCLEKCQIKIKVKDMVDDAAKQRLITIGQALAQNNQIDFLDYLEIETAESYTELINNLQYSLKKKKREAQQQMAYQQMIAQAQQEQQLQAQGEIEAMKQSAEDDRTEMKQGTKIASEIIKADSRQEPQQPE